MYEYNAMSKIMEVLLGWAKKDDIEKILEVCFEIGDYIQTTPKHVKSNFKILSKNTVAQGAKVYIKKRKGIISCPNCGYVGRGRKVLYLRMNLKVYTRECPKCGTMAQIVQGNEYIISKIKFKRKGSELPEEASYNA